MQVVMSDSNLPSKILVVDDDPTVAGGIKEPLASYGVRVEAASDVDSAFYIFNNNRIEVVCIDLEFEAQPGLIILQKWRTHENIEKRNVGVVLLKGNRNKHNPGQARLIQELQDTVSLVKPCTAIQLLPVLSRALAARNRAIKYEETKDRILKLGSKPGKLDKAIESIKRDISTLGDRGFGMMIDLYEKHEKYEEALAVIEPLCERNSNNVSYLNARGRVLLKLGRQDEALKAIELADKAAPGNINRLNELAEAYLRLNKPDSAVDKMRELIEYHPESPEYKFDLFSKLQDHGFDGHAQSLCRDTATPIEVVRHYNNKGVALKSVGSIDEALEEYKRSLEFFPKFKENYRILYNIALAHVGKKTPEDYGVALDFLDKCLDLKPDFEKAVNIRKQIKALITKKNQPTG